MYSHHFSCKCNAVLSREESLAFSRAKVHQKKIMWKKAVKSYQKVQQFQWRILFRNEILFNVHVPEAQREKRNERKMKRDVSRVVCVKKAVSKEQRDGKWKKRLSQAKVAIFTSFLSLSTLYSLHAPEKQPKISVWSLQRHNLNTLMYR